MNKVIVVGGIESKSGMSEKDGKKKPWTRYSIKDQADHFVGSTFSETIVGIIKSNIGQQVTLEIEEKENSDPSRPSYKDIVGAVPGVLATADDARAVDPRNATSPAAPDHIHMIRIAALKAASAAGASPDEVLSLADKFVGWITERDQVQHMQTFDPDEIPF